MQKLHKQLIFYKKGVDICTVLEYNERENKRWKVRMENDQVENT